MGVMADQGADPWNPGDLFKPFPVCIRAGDRSGISYDPWRDIGSGSQGKAVVEADR